jgi:hypothetical protein
MHVNHTTGGVGHARGTTSRRRLTPPQLVDANPPMPQSVRYLAVRATLVTLLLGIAISRPSHAQKPIPTPESSFGFPVGADYKLFDYEQSITYFRRLAAASNRIKLIDVGKTAFGRTITVALISSPENLARLDQIRRTNLRFAHPEGLTDAEAHRLARDAKAIVDISGGLHASEIAGSQHTPLVAYELLAHPDDPRNKAILDNVVLFLWPSINPDGQDIVVNWCKARDEKKPTAPMELYEKYVGHDNNRDSYMLNVVESRVIQRTWRDWEPDIIYVHHQSSPFPTRIWIPPFADPVGLRVPPIMAREVNAIGTRIAEELDANGQPGAVHQLATYDAWYPGYIDYMPMYQNIPSWWTETQGGNCATPRTTTVDSLPSDYRDLRPTTMYLSPWAQGKWGLRDAVNYMVTASLATLNYAAKFREEILYNRYQAGRNTIQQYRTSALRLPHSTGAVRSSCAGGVAQAHRVHGSPREAARSRCHVRRHVLSQGHMGHSHGSGVRAARARALRAAKISGDQGRHSLRRSRLDPSISDERERRRGACTAHGRFPRRAPERSGQDRRLAYGPRRTLHHERRSGGHRAVARTDHRQWKCNRPRSGAE